MTTEPITPPPDVDAILDAATDSQYAARFTEGSVQLIAPDGSIAQEAVWPLAGQYSRNLQRNIVTSVLEGQQ